MGRYKALTGFYLTPQPPLRKQRGGVFPYPIFKLDNLLCFPVFVLVFVLSGFRFVGVEAQPEPIAATIEVLSGLVEMQRVGTAQWLPIQVEGVIGVGDSIRTNLKGRARLTFFNDGTEIILEPATLMTINQLEADDHNLVLKMNLVVGQTLNRLQQGLGLDSNYEIDSQFGVISAEGTVFAIRQKNDGQLSFISFENTIGAERDNKVIDVQAGYGARIEVDGQFSDIVLASSFAELDSRLDGCAGATNVTDNRRLPVYGTPNEAGTGIGAQNPYTIDHIMGSDIAMDWYRIPFNGGFGWVEPMETTIDEGCVALRVFESDHVENLETLDIPPDALSWGYCVGQTPIPAGWAEYTVQPGESLYELAMRTGETVDHLQQVNCIADPALIVEDEVLYIPALN